MEKALGPPQTLRIGGQVDLGMQRAEQPNRLRIRGGFGIDLGGLRRTGRRQIDRLRVPANKVAK